MIKMQLNFPKCTPFKGSVSRVLRWVLLYINQKLFSRPFIAAHKILTFLKGQFTINKKQAGTPLYYDMGVSAILKFVPIWRKRTISVISSHSEKPVANFNIVNLNKSAEEFLPDKKARPHLNL